MRELCRIDIKDLLFIDIETCGRFESLETADAIFQKTWNKFAEKLEPNTENTYDKAGLYPEFGRIACISLGFEHNGVLRKKSFCKENEEELIVEAFTVINEHFSDKRLCGYNIINFDMPYLMKRALVYDIPIIDLIDMTGLKPWELSAVDLQRIYHQFSGRIPTLDAVCLSLGIPSPKEEMSGNEVHQLFWDKKFKKIEQYCEGDVETDYRLFKKMKVC